MRFSELEHKRVALWGYGREGRAALAALRRAYPQQRLTLFCAPGERAAVDALGDPALTIDTDVDAAKLAAFDAVIKSPGISPYKPPADAARALGATFTSGTALWFATPPPGVKLAVTGTKGKSTTTALIAHLLRARGLRVGLAGNIGLPLLDVQAPAFPPAAWAIELSSFQTADACDADVALLLNVYPEHLDWHGDEARYVADKLALANAARSVVLNRDDPRLRALGESLQQQGGQVRWFNDPDAWHLRGSMIHRGDVAVFDASTVRLPGEHNRINLVAALAAIEAAGFDPCPLAAHAATFRPLPHRLQSLGVRDGVEYVNDSISTTPYASLAALACHRAQPVAIIVGGYDRGIDWQPFFDRLDADAHSHARPAAIVTRGQNGPRVHALLRPLALRLGIPLAQAGTLDDALAQARTLLAGPGVVLLSPGAPSFGEFDDYTARGRAFAAAAGFDPDAISTIEGLGIA